jgi:hypothetical protein
MAKDILKSVVIGLFVTVGLLALTIIGNHTILGVITLPFTMPLALLAAIVGDQFMKGAGAAWGTISLYGFMVLRQAEWLIFLECGSLAAAFTATAQPPRSPLATLKPPKTS